MKIKRLIALALAVAIALTVSGCATSLELFSGKLTRKPGIRPGRVAADDGIEHVYFTPAWHDETNFFDIEYVEYDTDKLDRATKALRDLAKKGGSGEDFANAYYDLLDELREILTLYTLAELKSCQDAGSEEAQAEQLRMSELWYDARDDFMESMNDFALSKNKRLMRSVFTTSYIKYFEENGASTEEEKDMYLRQEELLARYRGIMSEADPDLDEAVDVYVELVKLRREISDYYEYDSFADYVYEQTFGRGYTPKDAKGVWKSAKKSFEPLFEEYLPDFQDELRWLYYYSDVHATPERIYETMEQVLPELSDELVYAYDYLRRNDLADIEPDDRKAGMGFTTLLRTYNQPFIFNSATGGASDFTSMYHEFGHFTNFFYSDSDFLFGWSDYDLSELQSQGMEALFSFYYEDLFGERAGKAMRKLNLLELISSVVEGALYDEFQQRVYDEDDLTAERVMEIYEEVWDEYDYEYVYGKCDKYRWVYVTHNFETPFYYISYAVSALGALELFAKCGEDWDAGLDTYLTAAAMDTELWGYSDALEKLKLGDVFDPDVCADVADSVEDALDDATYYEE